MKNNAAVAIPDSTLKILVALLVAVSFKISGSGSMSTNYTWPSVVTGSTDKAHKIPAIGT